MLGGPCRDRTRRDVGWTVQGQDQTRCWADRAGTESDEMMGGPCRDRTRRDDGRTVQDQARQDRGPGRVSGKQESRRYRDRYRQAGARTVLGQDQTIGMHKINRIKN